MKKYCVFVCSRYIERSRRLSSTLGVPLDLQGRLLDAFYNVLGCLVTPGVANCSVQISIGVTFIV